VAECSAHLTLIAETVPGDMSYVGDLHEQCTEVRSGRQCYSFQKQLLSASWIKVENGKPLLGKKAVIVLLPFSSTDFCEAGFSAFITKTKVLS